MPVDRFPLVGSFLNRSLISLGTRDQKFTNCFPEISENTYTGKREAVLVKRLGMLCDGDAGADVSAGATGSFGGVTWTSNSAASSPTVLSYVKSGGTSMQFFQGTDGTQVGGDVASTSACYYMSETLISTTGNLTAALEDSAGGNLTEMWFFPEGGAWTQITDGDFPSSVQSVHCHMDGYMFVITNRGVIHNSDLNSLSAWTAGSSITAQSMPDNGVGVARYRNLIVAFGDYSLEMFYNAGNASGSPLSRVAGSVRSVGAARQSVGAGPTIYPVGATVYWIGREATSGRYGIYRLNGSEPQKISTTAIDKMANSAQVTSILGAFQLHGMTHVAFNIASGTDALCYCADTGFWWFFSHATSISPRAVVGGEASASLPESFMTGSASAKVWAFSVGSEIWRDNAVAYTATAQTQPLDHGTHKTKTFNRLSIIGDTQSAASALSVSYSDDDGQTFSTARDIDMSTTQRSLFGLGSSRRRSWKFAHAANNACRIEAVEIEYDVGAS